MESFYELLKCKFFFLNVLRFVRKINVVPNTGEKLCTSLLAKTFRGKSFFWRGKDGRGISFWQESVFSLKIIWYRHIPPELFKYGKLYSNYFYFPEFENFSGSFFIYLHFKTLIYRLSFFFRRTFFIDTLL